MKGKAKDMMKDEWMKGAIAVIEEGTSSLNLCLHRPNRQKKEREGRVSTPNHQKKRKTGTDRQKRKKVTTKKSKEEEEEEDRNYVEKKVTKK